MQRRGYRCLDTRAAKPCFPCTGDPAGARDPRQQVPIPAFRVLHHRMWRWLLGVQARRQGHTGPPLGWASNTPMHPIPEAWVGRPGGTCPSSCSFAPKRVCVGAASEVVLVYLVCGGQGEDEDSGRHQRQRQLQPEAHEGQRLLPTGGGAQGQLLGRIGVQRRGSCAQAEDSFWGLAEGKGSRTVENLLERHPHMLRQTDIIHTVVNKRLRATERSPA